MVEWEWSLMIVSRQLFRLCAVYSPSADWSPQDKGMTTFITKLNKTKLVCKQVVAVPGMVVCKESTDEVQGLTCRYTGQTEENLHTVT